MGFWRMSARKTRPDKIRNTTIREMLDVKIKVKEMTEERRLKWYGHDMRMPEERILKKILHWQPEGNRRKERSKKKWMDRVRRSMRNHRFTDENAENRELWSFRIIFG